MKSRVSIPVLNSGRARSPRSIPRRRLLLVSLDWTRDKDPRIPLAQASLLAALRAASVDVIEASFPVNDAKSSPERVLAWIRDRRRSAPADLPIDVGLGVYVWNEPWIQVILPALKDYELRGRVILGGPQISYAGSALEQLYPHADVFIRGQAEQALVALMSGDEDEPVPGVLRSGADDHGTQAVAPLDALASPYLTGLIDVAKTRSFLRWETQRGCPYACSFCQHRDAGARVVRRFAGERIEQEAQLFARAGVRSVAILDPLFNVGAHPLGVLDALTRHGFTGSLSVQCHFAALRAEFLDACAPLDVRPEFGLQTIHADEARAVDRVSRLDRVEWGMSELRRRSIPFEVSLIYGLPNQTLRSFRESVEFCLNRGVPIIKAFPLVLLRGTKIEGERAHWGFETSDDPIPVVISSHTFDRREWREMDAISRALRLTEGHHPKTVGELLRFTRCQQGSHRWSPRPPPRIQQEGQQ